MSTVARFSASRQFQSGALKSFDAPSSSTGACMCAQTVRISRVSSNSLRRSPWSRRWRVLPVITGCTSMKPPTPPTEGTAAATRGSMLTKVVKEPPVECPRTPMRLASTWGCCARNEMMRRPDIWRGNCQLLRGLGAASTVVLSAWNGLSGPFAPQAFTASQSVLGSPAALPPILARSLWLGWKQA